VYAIIEDGGKQYKVQPGDILAVELRPVQAEQSHIEFDRVLFYKDDETTLIGQPIVTAVKVVAKITAPATGPKLHPLQIRRRKNSRRRIGHRQKYLQVEITDIVRS